MKPQQPSAPLSQPGQGLAALTVVMIIFFVMAMVAAYTNRNLVFEQRISTNSYKSARAVDAAEAAVDWTLSMLNGGVLTDNCTAPSAAALAANPSAFSDFRRRYLRIQPDTTSREGRWDTPIVNGNFVRMYPACVMDANAVLSCICPSLSSRNPAMVTPIDGIGSAFNVELRSTNVSPGTLTVAALGCANIGAGATSCYNQNDLAQLTTLVDAKSGINMTLALVRALPLAAQAPGRPQLATLTTGEGITSSGGTLTITNDVIEWIVRAGGTITTSIAPAYGVAGGSRSPRPIASDTALFNLAHPNPADDSWFLSFFGMVPDLYKAQPALIKVPCPGGTCTSASLTATLARYPRHPIWVDGNLTIDDAAALGSMVLTAPPDLGSSNPVMLVIDGVLTVNAATQITGFLHAKGGIVWNAAAVLRGALVTPGSFTATTDATLVYDKDVLNTIRLYYGSFVRVPGSWAAVSTF